MTQGFLQPKGSIKKQDIGPMVQQWAKEQAQGQLNSAPEVNPLRDTVQDLLLKNLQKDITIPKTYTTIQDIFNANEGDRFNALADWFQSPQFNRFTGGDYTFDPESKRMMSTGERIARRQEAQLKAEQEKALEAQKQQLGIAEGLNKEYNDMDIADKRLQADAEQFAQSLALEREQLEELKRHNRASEADGLGGGGYRLTPSQIITTRKEFSNKPEIKAYNEISKRNAEVNAVKNALKGSKRLNAEDQALIMNFNKALDPISVVRESEFARTAAGQSLLGRAEGALDKISRGGSGLSKGEREAIYKVIDVMDKTAKKRARIVSQEFSDYAERYNTNPRDILMQYSSLLEEPEIEERYAPKGGLSFL